MLSQYLSILSANLPTQKQVFGEPIIVYVKVLSSFSSWSQFVAVGIADGLSDGLSDIAVGLSDGLSDIVVGLSDGLSDGLFKVDKAKMIKEKYLVKLENRRLRMS